MKKSLLGFLVILSACIVKAQSGQSQNTVRSKSVYVELLGSGIGASANFDSRFTSDTRFGYRVGIGIIPLKNATPLTFPLGLNALFGRGSSHFEVEATATILTSTTAKLNGKKVSSVFIYPHVGYRYTKPTKSFFGRICAGPMFYGSRVIPYGGLSLGYTL